MIDAVFISFSLNLTNELLIILFVNYFYLAVAYHTSGKILLFSPKAVYIPTVLSDIPRNSTALSLIFNTD